MAKKWELTPEKLETIRDMAAKGCTEDNIARCVGIAPGTWYEKKKIHPEMDDVIKAAKASGEKEVVGYLWNILRDPKHRNHFAAITFYLKTQHRWKEVTVVQQNAPVDGVDGLNLIKVASDGTEEEIE